jgi:glutamate 5-kinase
MDWREHRTKALAEAKRVVVKIGSAVLTHDLGIDQRAISRLIDQIAALHDRGLSVVLVSSGAVAAGRRAIIACNECKADGGLAASQAVSAIGQSRLMHHYDEGFERFGKITAQILLTKDDFQERSRFLNARNTVTTLLDWRIIPIINENDSVGVAELRFGDNDFLASLVLSLVDADIFVNLTSASGVYDANPLESSDAKCMECIQDIACLDIEGMCSGKTSVGSGGMRSKLLAARRAAQISVPTVIVSGREPWALDRLFGGEELGTYIMPAEQAISQRKYWLAYHAHPAGTIVVDFGARRAVMEKGKSLLPIGIKRVEGNFEAGELVRIQIEGGDIFAVGLSNYAARDLRLVMGKKTVEIEEILGQNHYPEAVHRDNLVVDWVV